MNLPRAYLSLVLLGVVAACGGPAAPTTPPTATSAEVPVVPAKRAAAPPAATASAAATATASAATSSAPPAAPALLKRLPPATKAQLAGRCTAGSPIPIGKSSRSDAFGPNVAIAASVNGVVAAWLSSDSEVTTIPLDAAGQPRGEGRLLKSDIGRSFPRLWELGDGIFVLRFVPDPSHLGGASRGRAPRSALQRVDATGELVGKPVTFPLEDVDDVTYFQNELMFLTRFLDSREMLRVTASKEGLAMRQVPLPDSPEGKGGAVKRQLLVTSKGAARVVTDVGEGIVVLDSEDGGRVKRKLPQEYQNKRAVMSAEDEVLWPICSPKPTGRALKAGSGDAVEVDADQSVCAQSSNWRVAGDWNMYNGKNRGLMFKPRALDPGIKLSTEVREYWFHDSTWTGTHVLAIYAQGKRGAWTVVVHPITCDGNPS